MKYDTENKKFVSPTGRSYSFEDTTDEMIFNWIASGELSMNDFKVWYQDKIDIVFNNK